MQVRGFGMMIGIQLPKDCAELVAIARDQHKLIINVTAGSVVRLLPPINMTQAQADDLLERLVALINNYLCFISIKSGHRNAHFYMKINQRCTVLIVQ